jgi:very-short-patch-repair endonuclease
VDWPLQNKDILKQTQETLFENEGVYHGLCSYTILKRTHQNNSKKISKPQRKLYWIVSRIFKNAQLEYFFEGKFIDIAIPDKMIAIEYDGSYWHEHRKNNDEKRQKYLESFGWKFLRYLDHVPTKEEFLNDIKFIK